MGSVSVLSILAKKLISVHQPKSTLVKSALMKIKDFKQPKMNTYKKMAGVRALTLPETIC
jgi:hypothetical protein